MEELVHCFFITAPTIKFFSLCDIDTFILQHIPAQNIVYVQKPTNAETEVHRKALHLWGSM